VLLEKVIDHSYEASIMSFTDLKLSPLILKAVEEEGYTTPSPIQKQAIPAVIEGRDVMAAAQTGTGKTAGFTLPILHRLLSGKKAPSNHARALILAPTRELALQVNESITTYAKHTSLSSTVVFGGVKINPQMMKLRKGTDLLVATPGRLLDLYQQNAIKFNQIEVLQNLLFSATFSQDIRELAKTLTNNPAEISVSPRNTTVETVEQWVYPVDKKRKPALLVELMVENKWGQVLVFTKTKFGANKLSYYLEKGGFKSAAIHGNKSQGARTRALSEFKKGELQVLVATDIAARGLDIDQLPQVVNFDLPNVAEDYVHRIGRTGRAGASGQAVSLVAADEFKLLTGIERLIQSTIQRKLIDGFEPTHDLPASHLNLKPKKPKKPKVKSKKRYSPDSRKDSGKNSSNKNGANRSRSSYSKNKKKPVKK